MTKGEHRVGISFNPSSNPQVDQIKRMAADLIDLIEEVGAANPEQEAKRCAAISQTEIESAAMWAVKAATKQPRE